MLDCLHVSECPRGEPLISAESEWADLYAYAQALLDSHEEARALIDEARRRADAAIRSCADLRARAWDVIEDWGPLGRRPRPVADYRAAVLKAARFLGLTEGRAAIVHDLAGRTDYELAPPPGKVGPSAPAPAVASALGADLVGEHSWRSGATANRQARLRYLATTASKPDRTLFTFNKEPR